MTATAVRSLAAGHAHRFRVFLAAQRFAAAEVERREVNLAWALLDGTLRATPEQAQAEGDALSARDRAARTEWDRALDALVAEVDQP